MSRTRPAADEALARRDAILSAVAFAAQRFLVADEWESVIADVLGQLGHAADVSRAHVFQNVVLEGGIEASTHRFEWCAPGARPLIDDPETIDAPWGETQASWRASLAAGDAVSRNVRDLPEPERSMFQGEGIVSLLDVPIFAGREWWGTIGFDETERERDWTEGETDALRAAAGTLGAAIERQRTARNLREAEELYRTLVEQIPAAVYITEVGEQYVARYVSPRIYDVLGVHPDEFARMTEWTRHIHPDDVDRVVDEDRRTDASLEPFDVEYRAIHADGRTLWIRDVAQVVRDQEGTPMFWSGVMMDVTERKRAEEDLSRALDLERDAAARLRTLDEMKNTFLQAVSHDLRTPLAAVLGNALTLENEEIRLDDAERRDMIHRIAANAKKLQRLVTDLLDLDRLSRGLLEPNRSRVELSQLVRNVAAESDLVGGRTVVLELDRVELDVDGPKVERIVENLLVNAVRHTPASATIWVRVRPDEGGGLISVEDDGPGIPDELREAIFAAFERGPSSSEHAPGTGIGLALVARFAELHGGRAWVDRREGGGASFVVFLPGSEPGSGPEGPARFGSMADLPEELRNRPPRKPGQAPSASLTLDAYQRLSSELNELSTTGREAIAERIKAAREHGDIRENAEYDAAKDAQGLMEARIRNLRGMLRDPEIIEAPMDTEAVGPGMLVTLRPLDDEDPETETYLLAEHAEERAEGARTVTTSSPLGSALLGTAEGEEIVYEAPGGSFRYVVVSFQPFAG